MLAQPKGTEHAWLVRHEGYHYQHRHLTQKNIRLYDLSSAIHSQHYMILYEGAKKKKKSTQYRLYTNLHTVLVITISQT